MRLIMTAAVATMTFAIGGVAHAGAAAAPAVPAAPAAPSATDVAAARDAANSALPTVSQFFASGGRKPQGDARQLAAAAAAAAPRIDSTTVPVYYLAPAFVADPSSSGTATPVAQLSFMATDTVSASGSHASVWTARIGSAGWKVVNIASGSDETTYTAQAAPGAAVFEEPQIGAWYQVAGGRVLPLNQTARESVGSGVSLARYHQLVRTRYADKMPGSAYDKAGRAGGFQPQAPSQGSSTNTAPLTAGLVLVGFGAAGVGAVAWRRSRAQRG
ncbi:hypothetical protein ABH935_004485 [Catenulispora sp. GAS73]|uniref:hypothetical protein n=1 Tax=Catenulispora sp. GAS73 TaxID=3156269 RepID=UPI003514DB26